MKLLLLICLSTGITCAQSTQKKTYRVKRSKSKVTFKVDEVSVAKSLLKDTNYQYVFENRINKEILILPEDAVNKELVPIHMNGFLQAIHYAYADHRPLELSPDDVWLTICQGFSIHLNEHMDEYKDQIFTKERPETIAIRNDSLVTGKSQDWGDLIADLSVKANSYAQKDVSNLIVPAFSTTNSVNTTVYQITLLESMQKVFEFEGYSGCGIPSITLHGTKEDWLNIYTKMDEFKQFGLEEWVNGLKPILKQFHEASKGNIDKQFWKEIYKELRIYDKQNISGWVLKFFPYILKPHNAEDEPDEYGYYNKVRKYIPNEFLADKDYLLSKFTTKDIPQGFAKLDLMWRVLKANNIIEEHEMELFGGFIGVIQNPETKSVAPEISWAVCKKDADNVDHGFYSYGERKKNNHTKEFWLSEFARSPRPAIYHPKVNSTYKEGIDEIKREIKKDGIKVSAETKINFIVNWQGTIAKIEIDSPISASEKDRIIKLMSDLPYQWSPALKFDNYHGPGAHGKVDFKVNFKVTLTITP
jgi:Domain of unknown function (DUF4419)